MLNKFTIQILWSRPTFGSSSIEFIECSKFSCFARFIKAMFVSLLYKLVVIIHLANLQHKFLGLDQHLRQVSSNSKNFQNLTFLHGFIEASSFPFYTNLQLLLCLAYLPNKFLGQYQRLGQVSSNSENIQNLVVLHSLIEASSFPFYINLQLLLRLENLPHKF